MRSLWAIIALACLWKTADGIQCYSCLSDERAGRMCRSIREASLINCPDQSTWCNALVFVRNGNVFVDRTCSGNIGNLGFGQNECDIMNSQSLMNVGVAFYQCRGDACNNIEPSNEHPDQNRDVFLMTKGASEEKSSVSASGYGSDHGSGYNSASGSGYTSGSNYGSVSSYGSGSNSGYSSGSSSHSDSGSSSVVASSYTSGSKCESGSSYGTSSGCSSESQSGESSSNSSSFAQLTSAESSEEMFQESRLKESLKDQNCVLNNQDKTTTAEEDDDQAVIDNVSKERLPWQAARTEFFDKSYKEKRRHLGQKFGPIPTIRIEVPVRRRLSKLFDKRSVPVQIPDSFDARIQWPMCQSSISDVRDQGRCASCWAESAASVISDLVCIQSAGSTKARLSAQDPISCMPSQYIPPNCDHYTDLCDGFDVLYALKMQVNQGIVSGGEVNQPNVGCMPYDNQTYAHGDADIHTCGSSCTDLSYERSYSEDKVVGSGKRIRLMGSMLATWGLSSKNSYFLDPVSGIIDSQDPVTDTTENLIKAEIMTNGPVTASFDVHNDFFSYVSGVYQKTSASDYLGHHAVKLIGWGKTDSGVPYWLAVNSWGSGWGEKGLFRILRGSDHVKIESYVATLTTVGAPAGIKLASTVKPTSLVAGAVVQDELL